jgi:uncharacterized protein (TIGR02217 family)
MAHLAIEFPRDVAAGCLGTLERRDEIVTLASGFDEVNQRWAHARRRWSAGLGIRSADNLAAVLAVYEEARGRLHSFGFRDWMDWRSAPPSVPVTAGDQPLGSGDGARTRFALVKTYGAVNPYVRRIVLPHPASVRVAVGGAETAAGWTLEGNGVVAFDAAPPPGADVSAGFTFDVPVRFASSTLSVEWAFFLESGGSGRAPDVELVEVRLAGE